MKANNKSTERVRMSILLLPGEKADESGIFVSVNESTYMIRAGEEVEVPREVYEALEHSRYAGLLMRR